MLSDFLQFAPCGLILDACGVLLLGFSFFLKTTNSMIQESGTTWDSKAYITVAAGKCDGVFGTALLFLGFIYQAIHYTKIQSNTAIVFTLILLAAFLLVYFCWLRSKIINKWVSNIESKISGNSPN